MNDFDDLDDLDDLFGQLRSAATDAELAGERSQVDAMARLHRRQRGYTMISSRRARVAAFVAAGVIGFGGIAAASPGGPLARTASDDTTTTSTSEAPTTTAEVTTTTSEAPTTTAELPKDDDALATRSVIEQVSDADDADTDPDRDTEFDESTCLDGNHGKTVSAVARNESPFEEVEQRVAAQSSCGMDGADDGDDDGRPQQPGRPDKPGKPESPGQPGNGGKKNAGD
jgi:hypothetical protein